MKNCDYCGRENAPEASNCRECGTPFPVAKTEPLPPEPEPLPVSLRALAEKKMRIGAIWFFGGIMVTTMTYLSAVNNPKGGTYVIAWGAIVFGGLQVIRARKLRDTLTGTEITGSGSTPAETEDLGYAALLEGTRLEGTGRAQEAIAVYQKIIAEFPGTGASKDAQKSIESLRARIG